MWFLAIAAIAGFTLSLYGWGWAFQRLGRMERGSWPVTVALGLGAVVFLGGLLNLAGIAYADELAAITGAGVILAVIAWRLNPPVRFSASRLWVVVPAAIILIYAFASQVPAAAFNGYDDFEKYFMHPVRMLATGSLAAGPLSTLGSETLGGTAFLDGFAFAALPMSYANVVDGVFGLFLCLMLTGWLAGTRLAAVLWVVATAFIAPMTANISALYLGAALMIAAVALTADERMMGKTANAAAIGLVYAALISLKTTFAVFPICHLAAVIATLLILRADPKKTLLWGATSVGFTVLFLAPWIALHAPHYIVALTDPLADGLQPRPGGESFSLISWTFSSYGTAVLSYAVLLPAVVAGVAAASHFTRRKTIPLVMAVAAAATLFACFGAVLALAPILAGYNHAIRYFAPFAIALVPAIAALSAAALPDGTNWRKGAAVLLPCLAAIAAFATSVVGRVERAVDRDMTLAVHWATPEDRYKVEVDYSDYVLNGEMKRMVAAEQEFVPRGEPVIALINAPFYLDLDRNPVTDVELAGLATPWAKVPTSGYVMFEYAGIATPHIYGKQELIDAPGAHEWLIYARALKFAKLIERARKTGDIISDDGRFLVVRLPD